MKSRRRANSTVRLLYCPEHSAMKTRFIWLMMLFLLSLHAHAQQPTPTPSPSPKGQERIYTAKEVDVKAKIKQATGTPQPGRDCFEFDYPRVVVLEIVLHKSGVVSDVKLIKKSGCTYDKDAIRVARKMEFEPAKKNGQDVSQYLTVQYEYAKP
jgi:TonB family protein